MEANKDFAKEACRFCIEQGQTPIAVHLLYTQILDDNLPAEREKGLALSQDVLRHCEELWVCGDRISQGMAAEITAARNMGIPTREISRSDIQRKGLEQEPPWRERPEMAMTSEG